MKHKPLAKTSKRVFATLIDYGVFFAITWAYIMYFGEETVDGYEVSGIMVLPIPIFWFFYFVIIEGFMQATLGHQLFYLQVRQDNYNEIDIGHSFKRRILDIIDFMFFGVPAFISIRNNKKKQRIGDMYAKTIVVNDEYEDE